MICLFTRIPNYSVSLKVIILVIKASQIFIATSTTNQNHNTPDFLMVFVKQFFFHTLDFYQTSDYVSVCGDLFEMMILYEDSYYEHDRKYGGYRGISRHWAKLSGSEVD